MRKLETKEQLEKKQKRNQLILGVMMVILLTSSIAGYSIMSRDSDSDSTTSVSEYGVDFYRQSGVWTINAGTESFYFQNLPSDVEDVEVSGEFDFSSYSGQTLYFVNANEGATEILNNLGNYILRYQEACLVNSTCDQDIPTKDCANNIIIFELGNSTSVYKEDNCVYIIGDSVKGSDAFLYKVFGII